MQRLWLFKHLSKATYCAWLTTCENHQCCFNLCGHWIIPFIFISIYQYIELYRAYLSIHFKFTQNEIVTYWLNKFKRNLWKKLHLKITFWLWCWSIADILTAATGLQTKMIRLISIFMTFTVWGNWSLVIFMHPEWIYQHLLVKWSQQKT